MSNVRGFDKLRKVVENYGLVRSEDIDKAEESEMGAVEEKPLVEVAESNLTADADSHNTADYTNKALVTETSE